ncbi:MAG: MarC family protein [Desulfobacterota bacterium]|nr:MarC family protein [Thermodesulfobacteriota bacterium]
MKEFFDLFTSFRLFLPFIPFFVAFDPFGILPVFTSLTAEMSLSEQKRVVRQSTITAFLVGMGFLVAGRSVFGLLHITVSDFKVAGGILLFIIAIVDLIFPERTRTFPKETLGVVPIGIPLIVGPGVLTLLLMSAPAYGYVPTIVCFVLNLLLVWFVFNHSRQVMRFLKDGGTKGIGKIFALLLASFGVMMIRTGLAEWFLLFRGS